jgi:hypothetical protein
MSLKTRTMDANTKSLTGKQQQSHHETRDKTQYPPEPLDTLYANEPTTHRQPNAHTRQPQHTTRAARESPHTVAS